MKHWGNIVVTMQDEEWMKVREELKASGFSLQSSQAEWMSSGHVRVTLHVELDLFKRTFKAA